MNRQATLETIARQTFDVCVIGGGSTGAGVLSCSIDRRWKCILIDQQDFAYGSSSRSSKIIHGGLRYLKMLKFGSVREAVREREHLLKAYPELVSPLPVVLPVFGFFDLAFKYSIIRFYEMLAGKSSLRKAKKISRAEVLRLLPGFRKKGLLGGMVYWEGTTNDALLTITSLRKSVDKGGVVLNYCTPQHAEHLGDEMQSLHCIDQITGNVVVIRAKVFVNATGAWLDYFATLIGRSTPSYRLKPSKGVHVVVSNEKIPSRIMTIVPSATADKRLLYSFPWEHNLTVLGSTDTDVSGELHSVAVNQHDVSYILDAFNKSFPDAQLTMRDVVSVYCGLRPLFDNGSLDSYRRPREYKMWWGANNIVNIAGGKLTSFLAMGKRCAELIEDRFTFDSEANGGAKSSATAMASCRETRNTEQTPDEPLAKGLNVTLADVVYHTRYAFAQTVSDVLTRRTALTYAMKEFDNTLVERVAQTMAREHGRNKTWQEEQIFSYYHHWREYHPEFLEDEI